VPSSLALAMEYHVPRIPSTGKTGGSPTRPA